MDEEHRGVALVILGIIAVIAVIGLVLMFSNAKNTGALTTNWGVDGSSFACTSPCTLWPSHAGFDTRGTKGVDETMMADRAYLRNFVKVGPDIEFRYADGSWFKGECWCPREGYPQFMPTEEFAAIIPGTGVGASEPTGRAQGIPVDRYNQEAYAQVSYPSPVYGAQPTVAPSYYPLEPQFEQRRP